MCACAVSLLFFCKKECAQSYKLNQNAHTVVLGFKRHARYDIYKRKSYSHILNEECVCKT